MRKGRRERIKKGSREGIVKATKRQFEEKEGLNFKIRPCDVAIVSSSPQGMTSWSSSIKTWFLQAYRICNIKKMSWYETECKKMFHW